MRWATSSSISTQQYETWYCMWTKINNPTPYPEVNTILQELLEGAMSILESHFVGMYLDGSLASGDFDQDSDIVLSLCRILYTLQFGDVVSKPFAARWAKETLGDPWVSLIDRAWTGRHHPELPAEAGDMDGTLDFIRFTLECSQQFTVS
jgi:hypothetical protein